MTTGLGLDFSTSLLLYTQPPRVARSAGAIKTARATRMFMSLSLHALGDIRLPWYGHLLCHGLDRRNARGRPTRLRGVRRTGSLDTRRVPQRHWVRTTCEFFRSPARGFAVARDPCINPTVSPTSRYHPALTRAR